MAWAVSSRVWTSKQIWMSGPTAWRTSAICSAAMRIDSTGSRRPPPSNRCPVSGWCHRTNFQPSSTARLQLAISRALVSPCVWGVADDLVADRPAEELVDGHAQGLALDVPEGDVDPPFSIDTKRCVTRGQWAWANPKTVPMGLPRSRPSVALPGCAYVGRDQSHPIKRKTTDSCS